MSTRHETTEEKLAWLRELERGRGKRRHGEGDRAPARPRQAPRTRADRPPARPGIVRRARPVRAPPRDRVRDARQPAVGRRGRDRLRHGLRPAGLRLQPGLHRLRRLALRGLRREGLQGDGPGRQGRVPRGGDQRLRRRADPGGRRLTRRLRGDLLAERPGVRRRAADLADHGPVRRRRGLLACDHRLRPDDRGVLVHVHHRPRRREDGDRRGRQLRGPRRGSGARDEVGRRAPRRSGRGVVHRGRPLPAHVPAAEQPRDRPVRAADRSGRPRVARARHA